MLIIHTNNLLAGCTTTAYEVIPTNSVSACHIDYIDRTYGWSYLTILHLKL